MSLTERLEILYNLGKEFEQVSVNPDLFYFPGYDKIFVSNPWFTEEFVKFALIEWASGLNKENLQNWLSAYSIPDRNSDKTLAIVMAGNIPLVGFHDLICGFICGYKLKIKVSSKDKCLTTWVINRLNSKIKESDRKILVIDDFLNDFDAVIATGSNNTNRYFDHYFSSYPGIMRKNRNSVAILTGKETDEDLENLAADIFLYFGLGCRNVSKLYVPKNYDFNKLAVSFHKYLRLKDHVKYGNNLEYQYAILSMNSILHVNYENIILVESKSISAPVGIVNFEYYSDINSIKEFLLLKSEELQCVVTNDDRIAHSVSFGKTQHPALKDYSDNIDTIEFVLNV